MARIDSLFPPQGAIGATVFRRQRDGKTIAYMLSRVDRRTWRHHPRWVRSRETAQEFGGAAKAGSAIYRALKCEETRAMFRPYAHNHIARKLLAHAERPEGSRAADRYTFAAAIPALRGLDLSHPGSVGKCIRFTTFGPHHCPDTVRVQGLREAAAQIDPTGAAQLEFRLTRKTIRFPEMGFDAQSFEWREDKAGSVRVGEALSSAWIPIEAFPKEGLHLRLAAGEAHPSIPGGGEEQGGQPTAPVDSLVFLFIEWRQIRDRRKPVYLHHQGTIRLAAIRTTLDNARDMAQAGIQTPKPRKRYRKLPPAQPRKRFKHTHPEAYLKAALVEWMAPPPA